MKMSCKNYPARSLGRGSGHSVLARWTRGIKASGPVDLKAVFFSFFFLSEVELRYESHGRLRNEL